MTMTWIEYIASYTTPKPMLAVVPKAAAPQADKPVMASRYLGTRNVYKADGTFTERDMWTHAHFVFVGYIGYNGEAYTRIQDRFGVLTLPRKQVRLLDNVNADTVRIESEAA